MFVCTVSRIISVVDELFIFNWIIRDMRGRRMIIAYLILQRY